MLTDGELRELRSLSQNYITFSYDDYLYSLRGFLRKKDAKGALGVSIGWKRCYFELLQGRLIYYNSDEKPDKKARPDGVISMRYCKVIEAVGTKGFNIILSDLTYELKADDTSNRNSWMQALQTSQSLLLKIEPNPSTPLKDQAEGKEGIMEIRMIWGWKEFYITCRDGMLFILYTKNGPRYKKLCLYDATFSPISLSNQERFGFSIDVTNEGSNVQMSCKDEMNTQIWLTVFLKQKLFIEEALAAIYL